MANNRIKLNSLGIIEEVAPQYVQIGEAVVTVEHFIPYEKMLDMIQWCIDYIINDRPFISAPLKKIIKDFAILNFFTNFDLNFLTEYQDMADIYAEYDLVYRFDVMDKVMQFIDPGEIEFFNTTLDATLESIMKYRNSAVGIVDALSEKAQQDIDKMQGAIDLISDDEQNQRIGKLLQFAQQLQAPTKS